MRLFALYTGGKDSTLAIIKALKNGYNVDAVLTFISENPYSYMFHRFNVEWTTLQAVSMGFKHYMFKTKGVKERELEDLKTSFLYMRELGYEGVVAGAIASRYQKDRIDRIASEAGLYVYSPLWGMNQEELMYEYVRLGIKYMIISVSAWGLTRDHLGWIIDGYDDIEEIIKLSRRYRFNPTGEGGEYETFVLDAPLFKYPIKILKYRIIWEGDSGYLIIEDAKLDIPDIEYDRSKS